MKTAGTEHWIDAYGAYLYGHEGDYVFSRRGTDIESAIADYFGNTQVLFDKNGNVTELINYRPDHTMSMWQKGVWTEGKWLINSGQDSSKVFHTFEVLGKFASWRHAFARDKRPGDYWINPETDTGIPVANGGINVERKSNGRMVLEKTDINPGAYYALVEGMVNPPNYDDGKFDYFDEYIKTVGTDADKAMENYIGNTFYFRNDRGKLVEAIYYNLDHTVRAWRDGHWCDGLWLLNNGQDNSVICQTRDDIFDKPASWCHPFTPYKKPGDVWIAPETRHDGDPSYPLTAGGIPVVTVGGKYLIVGTNMEPREYYRIERGHVSLEELQNRAF